VSVQRVAHAAIRVEDADATAEFYLRLLGLTEVARGADGVRFLSGGRTRSFDLALVPGGAGLDHLAFAVGGPAELEDVAKRLEAEGIEIQAAACEEPGVAERVRFELPTRHVIELVALVEPEAFVAPRHGHASNLAGVGPVRIDHVTLLTPLVEQVTDFVIRVLGLRLSESVQPEEGFWFNAFLRARDQHHDVAFFFNGEDGRAELNHVAFRVGSFDDIRRACDLLAELGGELDSSPGRHEQGNNLFVYFKDPSGNRVELSTDMAAIDAAAPPRILRESRFEAWRPGIPPKLLSGT
jgi:catechol 2,3-dioxygenase